MEGSTVSTAIEPQIRQYLQGGDQAVLDREPAIEAGSVQNAHWNLFQSEAEGNVGSARRPQLQGGVQKQRVHFWLQGSIQPNSLLGKF